MDNRSATNNLAGSKQYVKCTFQSPALAYPTTVIHHNGNSPRLKNWSEEVIGDKENHYGVSASWRVLQPGVFFKRFDLILKFLQGTLRLSPTEAEGIMRLLRYKAFCDKVYPQAWRVCMASGCSRATFWRAIQRLKAQGFIRVINRYLIRPHAQISNLYDLRVLLILIARYLAEHGLQFAERWLKPYLSLPGTTFWRLWAPCPESSSDPGG